MQQLFAHSGAGSLGLLSIVLLVFSCVSFTKRIQRMYLQAWRLEPVAGVRGSFNAAQGLVALVLELTLLYLARQLFDALPFDWVLGVPVSFVASLALWTSIPWLLLDRRIPWRRLLPAGALMAVGTGLYSVASTIYMPGLMESYSERYGLFGVTVALVGWLLCIAVIMVVTTVLAAEFDRAPDPWARHLRARLGLEPSGGAGEGAGDGASPSEDDPAAPRAGV